MSIVKYLSVVFSVSILTGNIYASTSMQSSMDSEDDLLNNDKKKTIVLNESKKEDEAIQGQLDNLLEELMAEMDSREGSDFIAAEDVISTAFDYEGVRYRYGGTTYSGIDCSGLVMNAFSSSDIRLPRSSSDMAKVGEKINKSNAQKGDLIFFKTRGNRISHVGIITEVNDKDIKFIHSSTTRGVIVSSINEPYYHKRFVQINRVMQ